MSSQQPDLNRDKILTDITHKLMDIYQQLYRSFKNNDVMTQALSVWDERLIELVNSIEMTYTLDRNSDYFKSVMGDALHKVFIELKSSHQEEDFELLVLLPKSSHDDPPLAEDEDIANVIKKRLSNSQEKKFIFFPLNSYFMNVLANSKDNISYDDVTKLSFLQHWSVDVCSKEIWENNEIVKNINAIAKKMPKLEEIVLRGCCSASIPAFQRPLFNEKKIQIVAPSKQISEEKLDQNQILFQQIKVDNELITRVRFLNLSGKSVTKEIKNIPLNPPGNKLSKDVEEAIATVAYKEGLPPLALETQRLAAIESRNAWKNKKIPESQRLFAKSMFKNLRTFEDVASFNPGTLAFKVKEELNKIGKDNIKIKGYVHVYEATENGAIGYENSPKAIRI
ncbi:Uncharacterised protein [Legionella lansingensis]|uniref:Uncharacterized protein n=1 Tax=Legionella lansingensis TaxID=45067 RepID=A0A0W0VY71_9GAMM|nr:hypothetical protein [Legionella lansingensis]KTD24963.1 hypothetical protein Llan_0268 [Legionella lansingensis]SNV48156.1 Uncharacterised protein [Legionella lansingensis]